MAEQSFPVLEQPLSDQQWGQIAEGFGSGIMARGTEPYGIPAGGIDNAANTVTIGGRSALDGDGRAVLAGFFHRYDADVVMSVPAVTSTTTYHLGLTYDPTKHDAPNGPVSLTLTKSAPAGGGKKYLPIYTITRRANELLSSATIQDRRAFIASTITVKGSNALPPADSVLTYTVATDWETGQQWQMQRNGAWEAVGAQVLALRSPASWDVKGDVVAHPLADGRVQYVMEVRMTRTGSTPYTQGTQWSSRGAVLPPGLRAGRGTVYVPAMIADVTGHVAINTDTGQLLTRLTSGTKTLHPGAIIAATAVWTA